MALEEDLEKLYKFGEKLNAATDKSQNVKDYMGILAAATGSKKAKLLAAQLIPRFFKHFPQVSAQGLNAQFDLCEDDDVAIRIQAVRGLPFLCKDTPEHLPKLADVLCQLLLAEDQQEQIIVQNSLMQVVRQNPKDSLATVFKHVENAEDNVRGRVFDFIRTKIYPNRASLLVPPETMERHIADLIKGLQDVTGDEFQMLMTFLKSLSLFGPKASPERMQELADVVEAQADLDSKFDISDADHLERILACLQMAVPFYAAGASNARFLGFINKHVLPSIGKLSESKKLELLRNVAECAPYTAPSDARVMLPTLVDLLKKDIPKEKTEGLNYPAIECLVYIFHHLAYKVPNATNPLCGYKAYTGQPSDRLGEDFSAANEDWMKRLTVLEEDVKKKLKQLMQGMVEHNKAEKGATDEAAKADVKAKKAVAAQLMRSCTNIEKMAKVLHAKIPSFMSGTTAPILSWKPESNNKAAPKAANLTSPPVAGVKRPNPTATNGAGGEGAAAKRARPPGQLASRALQGLSGQQQQQQQQQQAPPRMGQAGGTSNLRGGLAGRRRPWQQRRK